MKKLSDIRKVKLLIATFLIVTMLISCNDSSDNAKTNEGEISEEKESNSKNEIEEKEDIKAGSFKEALELGLDMDRYAYSGEITVKISGEAITGGIPDAVAEKLNIRDNTIEIGVYADGEVAKEDFGMSIDYAINEAVKSGLIDVILTNSDMYVNIDSLRKGIDKIYNLYTGDGLPDSIVSLLPDGKNIRITKQLITDTVKRFAGDDFEYDEAAISGEVERYYGVAEYFACLIKEGFLDAIESFVIQDRDTYSITINNDNIDEIAAGTLNRLYMNTSEAYAKISGVLGDEFSREITEENLREVLENVLQQFEAGYIKDNLSLKFECILSASYVNDIWNIELSAYGIPLHYRNGVYEEEDFKVSVDVSYSADGNQSVEILPPNEVISDKAVENVLSDIELLVEEYGDRDTIETIAFDLYLQTMLKSELRSELIPASGYRIYEIFDDYSVRLNDVLCRNATQWLTEVYGKRHLKSEAAKAGNIYLYIDSYGNTYIKISENEDSEPLKMINGELFEADNGFFE